MLHRTRNLNMLTFLPHPGSGVTLCDGLKKMIMNLHWSILTCYDETFLMVWGFQQSFFFSTIKVQNDRPRLLMIVNTIQFFSIIARCLKPVTLYKFVYLKLKIMFSFALSEKNLSCCIISLAVFEPRKKKNHALNLNVSVTNCREKNIKKLSRRHFKSTVNIFVLW